MSKEEKTNIPQGRSWIRFERHMPRSNDLTLIILKGHLLIEQEINDILDSNLTDSKALLDARLTFSHRLAIIKAIYGSFESSKFPYNNIEKLNTLRNQLVHNLEPKNLEEHVLAFVQEIEGHESKAKFSKMKLEIRLRRSIAYLCGLICGYRGGYREGRKDAVREALAKLKNETAH